MDVEHAARVLRAGGLVAFPTETVYGLGADARSARAVRKIFAAKGRPPTNPLIVHVSGVAMAKLYTAVWSDTARRLAQRFWPGPLTLVVPRYRTIAAEVSAGLDTVGLRMPNHPLALELIRRFDGPVAAPSANRSMRVSPTTAKHVREELGDRVDIILDGGPCKVGIESTVLDLTTPRPVILRPGGIGQSQIEKLIGPIDMSPGIIADVAAPTRSPGQHELHYAPMTPAYRFSAPFTPPARSGVLTMRSNAVDERFATIPMPESAPAYAQRLYAALRELDAMQLDAIYIEWPPDLPEWAAVRDRILRATSPPPAGR
jgi:L-threonylcarbamoyladenylate synthase